MKNIFSILKFTLFMVVLLAVIYPMAILNSTFPIKEKENITVNGKVVVSKIGQNSITNYFWEDLRWIITLQEVGEAIKDQVT
jgi:K+-transporting ATPase ATPase C chain